MVNITVEFRQLRAAIKKLPAKDRVKLVEELQKDTWQEEFRQLLARIDRRLKKNPISEADIDRIVEEAREEFHARRR